MANEVIELPMRSESSSNMPVTRDDVDALKRQRELLREFIGSQLKEGINNDYAVIPGTNKKSLLKPGAEKLARLFGLGVRLSMADKEIDRHENFAMFTYKAEVYLLKNPSVVIADCEASCNSQEKKYKERTVYVNGAKTKEQTPIFDILNTLQKMCQKRAMVGAMILAVGGSDFFTQDIDDEQDAAQLGVARTEVKKAAVSIPRAVSATSQDQTQNPNPPCCGRPMMVSKYPDRETGEIPFYCTVCKSTKPRPA